MFERVTREIERLHRFFEQWFAGTLPDDDQAFSAVRDVLADGFLLVSPRGVTDEREPLLESIRDAHGGQQMEIWIENVDVRHATDSVVVATYEEWQSSEDEEPRGRLSTVVFRRDADRLRWLHVHETWLPTKD